MDKKNDHIECTLNDGAFITASSSDVFADFALWFLPIWVKIYMWMGKVHVGECTVLTAELLLLGSHYIRDSWLPVRSGVENTRHRSTERSTNFVYQNNDVVIPRNCFFWPGFLGTELQWGRWARCCCSALRVAQAINSLPFVFSMKILSAMGFHPGNAGIFLNVPLAKHAGQCLFMNVFASVHATAINVLFPEVALYLMAVAKVGLGCSCSQSMVPPAGFLPTKALFHFHRSVYHPWCCCG